MMAEMPKAFVTGFPVKHSRSPMIHRHWLARYGLSGTYDAIEVAPEDFPSFVTGLKTAGFAGGNVTIPHKVSAFEHAERRDAAAEAIGAVNTLWFENGVLCGGNTDSIGFSANLDDQCPDWRAAGRAMVFGAGGAAQAVLHALIETGVQHIDLVNRTRSRADELARRFGEKVHVVDWQTAAGCLPDAELLVNTTSLGMKGQPDFPLDLEDARADAIASDIVYIPLETPFLERARRRGLACSDGIGMLLHQAAPGFAHWFGVMPEVDEDLRTLVLADINKAQPA